MEILLVHAFPFDARFWDSQLKLAPPDVPMRAFDLPGFGSASGRPAQTIDDMAEAIQAASQGMQRFVLCGLSMGGYASFAWWRRFGGDKRVAGIVLADSRAEADTSEGKAGRDAMIQLVQEKGPSAVADQMMPKLFSAKASSEVVAGVRAIIGSQAPEGIAGAAQAMRDRPDSVPLLPSIRVPVLGIVGEEDTLTPIAFTERIVRGVPDGRLVTIPQAGHLSNLEKPRQFIDTIVAFARSLA